MSAQLAGDAGNSFHARLVLAAGVSVTINATSMQSLSAVVALLQPTEAANEGNVLVTPAAAAKALAGKPASQTAASSATSAAAQGDAGNASAATATQASVQPAAGGSAPSGEQGNGAAANPSPAPAAASTASSSAPSESPAVTFEELKKAFLALSTKAAGREKCEGVLKPFGLAKLSGAAPEQYAAVLAEIQKASV